MVRIGRVLCVLIAAMAVSFTGCDDAEPGGGSDGGGGGVTDSGPGGGGSRATGEGPCEEADECEGDVCVALIDGSLPPVYCSQPCGGGCPSGFYCDDQTFGMVGIDFCRYLPEGATEPPAEPTPPEEPPRLPCVEDDDCEGAQVCAEQGGERGCTIECANEDDCTVEFGGVRLDLATCQADQRTDVTRDVCVPDPACYPNVMMCIDTGFP